MFAGPKKKESWNSTVPVWRQIALEYNKQQSCNCRGKVETMWVLTYDTFFRKIEYKVIIFSNPGRLGSTLLTHSYRKSRSWKTQVKKDWHKYILGLYCFIPYLSVFVILIIMLIVLQIHKVLFEIFFQSSEFVSPAFNLKF